MRRLLKLFSHIAVQHHHSRTRTFPIANCVHVSLPQILPLPALYQCNVRLLTTEADLIID